MIDAIARMPLADLPTPVSRRPLRSGDETREIWVKHDDVSGRLYGGNKIRKLEFIFHRAALRKATRVATFGAVASNHALATALYARQLGLDCTCFLSHQDSSAKTARALATHLRLGTELVYFGGDYRARIQILRRYAQRRNCWLIPIGGSSWLGTVGFVNAALELAEQIEEGLLPCPDELYVATGTMGTTAGLALGLALAALPVRVQAVRVTDERFASKPGLQRLIAKTAIMLRAQGTAIPANIETKINIEFRDEYFAGGYARSDAATERAVRIAADSGLELETTYTGKAMAALLDDIERPRFDGSKLLFWNTYNSRALPPNGDMDIEALPEEFRRYFD